MADTFKTLSDLVLLNDKNAVDYGINDLFNDSPLVQKLAADYASNGTLHKYLKQTADAAVGFRSVNAGIANTVSTDVMVTVTLKLLDASDRSDVGEAIAYNGGPEAYVAREVRRKLKAAMFTTEKQIINGVAGPTGYSDATGFAGLLDSYNSLANTQVLTAGGSTANGTRSVYLIRTNDAGTDAQVIIGKSGKIEVGETITSDFTDAAGKHYPIYLTPVHGWMGLQVGSTLSVVRIANIDATHPVTDALIYKALAKFPASRQPNLIVMGRDSLSELRASRTATNATGAAAPRPTEVEGIEIVVTDALSAIEAVVA